MRAGVRPFAIPLTPICIPRIKLGRLDIRTGRIYQAIEFIVLAGRIVTRFQLVGNIK